MKKNLLFIIALFVCAYSYGQGEMDANRVSSNDLQGTARSQAMGGAFGALGGDIGGIAINPAGIGVYRSSEIVTTLGITNVSTETNSRDSESKTKFNFDNVAYVGYFPLGSDNVQSINFSFAYNRLKNFDRKTDSYNANRPSSLTHYMADLATYNGVNYWDMNGSAAYSKRGVPWLSILGWQGYLMDDIADNEYASILNSGEKVNSGLYMHEKGSIESYDFTVGTNISNQLYLGLTFSLTDIYYYMSSDYREDFEQGAGFSLENYLETDGSGYQLKLGAIYRPTDQFRIGIAYHSPTWYSLTDYYQGVVRPDAGIPNNEGVMATPGDAYTNYKIQAPYSWTFSGAMLLGTRGSISLDYEIKDYTTMHLKDNYGNDYVDDNNYIDEDFKVASTLRAGLEWKFTPQFSGRLGYAWMQNPYSENINDEKIEVTTSGTVPQFVIQGDTHHITAGLGYRFTPQFYMDVAFIYKTQSDKLYYFPYIPDYLDSESVSLKSNTYRGLLTLGYKF